MLLLVRAIKNHHSAVSNCLEMVRRELVLFLLPYLLLASSSEPYHQTLQLVKLSLSIVKYLQTNPIGLFECWFYRERLKMQTQDKSLVHQILESDDFHSIPKRILTSPFNGDAVEIERASVIFFEFRSNVGVFREVAMLWRVDPKTKLLIFIRGSSCRDIPSSIHVELSTRLEVFYLLVDGDIICRSLPLTREMLEFHRSVPMKVLFEDRTLKLNGYPITCVLLGFQNFLYAEFDGRGVGPSLAWLKLTANMVNASFRFVSALCKELNNECWWNAIMKKEGGFNDLILDTFSILTVNPLIMPRLDLSSFVILTPRGRRFGVEELFTAPFQLAVWIVLILCLIALKFIEVFLPSHFKNDLILLPLCGLERRNFVKSSRTERITLTALIVFFFVILNVYEVKITTLMTNRPCHADIKSIEDLNRNGIKIFLPPCKLTPSEESHLNLQFEHIAGAGREVGSMDGIHTYLLDEESAVLFRHMCHGDEELASTYTILGEKVRMFMRGNHIFNPTLKEPFRLTHEALIESGIHHFLRESLISHSVGGLFKYRTLREKLQVSNILNMADLQPAWISLGMGFAVSSIALLLELFFKFCLS